MSCLSNASANGFLKQFEQAVLLSFEDLGTKSALRDACQYSLTGSGKRLRPLAVFFIADALGNDCDIMPSALSVEFFHTASLIVDDLPCMDNDDMRRGKPALHKVVDESTALLASYSLITAAFDQIYLNGEVLQQGNYSHEKDFRVGLALHHAARAAGIQGATGGQFLDVFHKAKDLEDYKELIYKKTVTLFEIAFLFGWIFGGGPIQEIEHVKTLAYHLGMAFQISDDLCDEKQDLDGENVNIVNFLGREQALELFDQEIDQFYTMLDVLKISNSNLPLMAQAMIERVASCLDA